MSELITISNGREFYRIPPDDLNAARGSGFYSPAEYHRTIVSNGTQILEIPLTDVSSAEREGFRDVLCEERAALMPDAPRAQKPDVEMTRQAAQPHENRMGDQPVSSYRQAELEWEEYHDQLTGDYENASIVWKIPAFVRLMWFRYRDALFGQLRTNGISIAIHVAILLLLSAVLLVEKKVEKPGFITVSNATEELIEEVVIETVEIEVDEPVEEEVEVTESVEIVSEVTEQFVSIDVAESFDAGLLAAPTSGASEGDGEKMEKPTKAKVKFFGAKTEAIDFVFVIDNSNSMTKGRFETALNELVKAVNNLNKRQKFYVIFYSDTAYPLFHPQPPRTLVPATQQNKQLLVRWLQSVPLCLRTDGMEALRMGLSLKPDVMFVLGDGAFTDGASKYFTKNPANGVIVHTLGMEVNPKNAETFLQLAKAHGGTYQDVGVHPQAALIAKQFPRKRNNSRNGFWGLKLPIKPKNKK